MEEKQRRKWKCQEANQEIQELTKGLGTERVLRLVNGVKEYEQNIPSSIIFMLVVTEKNRFCTFIGIK